MFKRENQLWLLIGWIILAFVTYQLLYTGYDIYWGDALAGTYEYGLPFVFFGWIPLVIGLCLLPANLALIVLLIISLVKNRTR